MLSNAGPLSIAMSGFIIKAQTQGGAYVTKPLRESYEELVADLADSFNLIPASVTLFSKHNGTQLWVHMGSKGDLDVVLAEAAEYGSHVVNIEVSGVSAVRGLDAAGCLAATAATVSQLTYLWWLMSVASVSLYREVEVASVLILACSIHLGSLIFVLDDETANNHPFRQWVRPLLKRSLLLLLGPFSSDVLPLASCGLWGCDAPLRFKTREAIVGGGLWTMVLQDGVMLSVLFALHLSPDESNQLPLAPIPMACLYATLASLALNAPRRLAHFLVSSCEAAYHQREELAEEAQIGVFASNKMAAREKLDTPQSRPVLGTCAVAPSPIRGESPALPQAPSQAPSTAPSKVAVAGAKRVAPSAAKPKPQAGGNRSMM